MQGSETLGDLGEKALIAQFVLPSFNPLCHPDLAGDDCAVLRLGSGQAVCLSTDRVPADLISYQAGWIDEHQLGYYLAILNISDIAAMGAIPKGLLLNLALPSNTLLHDFAALIDGVASACAAYNCEVLGGDISSSSEWSLSATSIGIGHYDYFLRRSGAQPGDLVFCSKPLGLTPAAFRLLDQGILSSLGEPERDLLLSAFRNPKAMVSEGLILSEAKKTGARITAMDNTDGILQTLRELASASSVRFVIDKNKLVIPEIVAKVSHLTTVDSINLALSSGADFQIVGTASQVLEGIDLNYIGEVVDGNGVSINDNGNPLHIETTGWDYFTKETPSALSKRRKDDSHRH